MADNQSFQEKTEAPTPRRREEAREEGRVARSQEIGTALLILSAAASLHIGAPALSAQLAALFGNTVRSVAAPPVGVEATAGWLRGIGWTVLAAVAPIIFGMTALVALAGAIQARGVLSLKPLQPQWSRMSPIRNLKQRFGLRSLVELAKSIFKMLIVGIAVYLVLSRAWPEIASLPQRGSPAALALTIHRSTVMLLLVSGLAMLGLAAADYGYQLWEFEKNLRMSREEIKRELKESEGDPMVRARLRTLGRSLTRNRMMSEVPTADVVVTNPTRIAVALKYDPEVAPAPIVVAMGERKIAARIRKLAYESGVPVIENRPLARALRATARIGEAIPPELYVAVAEVLAFVIRQREAAKRRWKGAVVE